MQLCTELAQQQIPSMLHSLQAGAAVLRNWQRVHFAGRSSRQSQ